jgi:hypothetical protein
LIIGKVDGTLDVWDLTDTSHKPSVTVPVASCSVTTMSFRESSNQQVLGVGDSGGNLHILGIPRNLMRKLSSEESSMKSFFDREVRRVAYVADRNKIRDAEREVNADDIPEEAADAETVAAQAEAEAKEMAKAEAVYRQLEAKFREELGINDEAADPSEVKVDVAE